MLVVSDTTAITSLMKIGRASLLVELSVYHRSIPAELRVVPIRETHLLRTFRGLNFGEAQAIILAKESRADLLLIDEKRGREVAEAEGLRCLGLLGVILLAKEAGKIGSVREFLVHLQTTANFYVSAEVAQQLLKRAGE
jgi:uncharacterized protein